LGLISNVITHHKEGQEQFDAQKVEPYQGRHDEIQFSGIFLAEAPGSAICHKHTFSARTQAGNLSVHDTEHHQTPSSNRVE
jgi:hypothetical protein